MIARGPSSPTTGWKPTTTLTIATDAYDRLKSGALSRSSRDRDVLQQVEVVERATGTVDDGRVRVLTAQDRAARQDRKPELHGEAAAVLVVVTHSAEIAARFPRHFALEDGRCVAV